MPKVTDESEPILDGYCAIHRHHGEDGYDFCEGHASTRWGYVIVNAHDGLAPSTSLSFIWDGRIHRRYILAFYSIKQLDNLAKRFAEEIATQLKF